MKRTRFLIKLADHHKRSGLSAYEVAKRLNLNEVTVRKYLKQNVVAEFLPDHVIELVKFYGLNWQDPNVIEVIEVDEEEETESLIAV
jgi:hypothetical protein